MSANKTLPQHHLKHLPPSPPELHRSAPKHLTEHTHHLTIWPRCRQPSNRTQKRPLAAPIESAATQPQPRASALNAINGPFKPRQLHALPTTYVQTPHDGGCLSLTQHRDQGPQGAALAFGAACAVVGTRAATRPGAGDKGPLRAAPLAHSLAAPVVPTAHRSLAVTAKPSGGCDDDASSAQQSPSPAVEECCGRSFRSACAARATRASTAALQANGWRHGRRARGSRAAGGGGGGTRTRRAVSRDAARWHHACSHGRLERRLLAAGGGGLVENDARDDGAATGRRRGNAILLRLARSWRRDGAAADRHAVRLLAELDALAGGGKELRNVAHAIGGHAVACGERPLRGFDCG